MTSIVWAEAFSSTRRPRPNTLRLRTVTERAESEEKEGGEGGHEVSGGCDEGWGLSASA